MMHDTVYLRQAHLCVKHFHNRPFHGKIRHLGNGANARKGFWVTHTNSFKLMWRDRPGDGFSPFFPLFRCSITAKVKEVVV